MDSISQLKKLREETGISMIECKKALEEAGSNLERAKEILREKGKEMIKDKGSRGANQGLVASYIHPGSKLGVLLQIHSETDFVAKSEEFKKLARELCLQIAAMKPLFLREEDIPEDFLDGERKIYQKQFADSGKPKEIVDKIIDGKLEKYKKEICLESQSWVKEPSKNVSDLLADYVAKIGERIEITKFSRYEI